MAALADADLAVDDLEGLLLRLAYRPVVTIEDAERIGEDLQRIRSGQETIRKYLAWMRSEGWDHG